MKKPYVGISILLLSVVGLCESFWFVVDVFLWGERSLGLSSEFKVFPIGPYKIYAAPGRVFALLLAIPGFCCIGVVQYRGNELAEPSILDSSTVFPQFLWRHVEGDMVDGSMRG